MACHSGDTSACCWDGGCRWSTGSTRVVSRWSSFSSDRVLFMACRLTWDQGCGSEWLFVTFLFCCSYSFLLVHSPAAPSAGVSTSCPCLSWSWWGCSAASRAVSGACSPCLWSDSSSAPAPPGFGHTLHPVWCPTAPLPHRHSLSSLPSQKMPEAFGCCSAGPRHDSGPLPVDSGAPENCWNPVGPAEAATSPGPLCEGRGGRQRLLG